MIADEDSVRKKKPIIGQRRKLYRQVIKIPFSVKTGFSYSAHFPILRTIVRNHIKAPILKPYLFDHVF